MSFKSVLIAETRKIRKTPILWISVSGGAFIGILIFLAYFFEWERFISMPNTNPWTNYVLLSFSNISILLLPLYIVILTSSITYIEHSSNTWKYLYILPITRWKFYFSKLFVILILLAITYLIFIITTLLGGYLLGIVRPDLEFQLYKPDIITIITISIHSYVAVLAMTALQYWFSIRWKNYLYPVGLGILGMVSSIMVTGNSRLSIFFPYSYANLISLQSRFSNTTRFGVESILGLTNIEWLSIFYFLLFTAIGILEQTKRNVK